ncbi:MAG: hypothetical protein ACREJ2_00840 [Planctomycetota bacterium]
MKKALSLICLAGLLWVVIGGCEDDAAIQQERKDQAAAAQYQSDFQACNTTFQEAKAKEAAGSLDEAKTLYGQAADQASQLVNTPGPQQLQLKSIANESSGAVTRLAQTMDEQAKAAIAQKKEAERLAKLKADEAKAAAKKQKEDSIGHATVAMAPVTTGDPSVKTPPATTPGATPTAGGGDDDDTPTTPGKANGAGNSSGAGAPAAHLDPYKPLDEKSPFKCYLVKQEKKYCIGYVIVKNTTDKQHSIARFLCSFATAKDEHKWDVVAFFKYDGFKTNNWDDLDGDNPNAIGIAQVVLAPGESVKLVVMSDKADREGEYAGAVKLDGTVLFEDGSEQTVINND